MRLSAGVISLGCSRNQVDSEVMLGSLKRLGLKIVSGYSKPDICIINTCAFIQPAREESIEIILEAIKRKRAGDIKIYRCMRMSASDVS